LQAIIPHKSLKVLRQPIEKIWNYIIESDVSKMRRVEKMSKQLGWCDEKR
jgi:hypothetical protein